MKIFITLPHIDFVFGVSCNPPGDSVKSLRDVIAYPLRSLEMQFALSRSLLITLVWTSTLSALLLPSSMICSWVVRPFFFGAIVHLAIGNDYQRLSQTALRTSMWLYLLLDLQEWEMFPCRNTPSDTLAR